MDKVKHIIILAIGLFMIYWAQAHSPKAGVGKIITNELSGSYTMSESWYYISVVAGSVIGLVGLLGLYRSLK